MKRWVDKVLRRMMSFQCSPLDVDFNRQFKIRIRQKWQAWMIETVKAIGTVEPPERVDVSAWIADTFQDMEKPTIIQSAWLKKGHEWLNN